MGFSNINDASYFMCIDNTSVLLETKCTFINALCSKLTHIENTNVLEINRHTTYGGYIHFEPHLLSLIFCSFLNISDAFNIYECIEVREKGQFNSEERPGFDC